MVPPEAADSVPVLRRGPVVRVASSVPPKPARHWTNSTVGDPPPSACAGEPQTYQRNFMRQEGPRECPVKGCQRRAAMWAGLCMHFLHHHMRDTVIIVVEGKLHHPWCTHCDMLISWAYLNRRHPNTAQGTKETYQKRQRLAVEEAQAST